MKINFFILFAMCFYLVCNAYAETTENTDTTNPLAEIPKEFRYNIYKAQTEKEKEAALELLRKYLKEKVSEEEVNKKADKNKTVKKTSNSTNNQKNPINNGNNKRIPSRPPVRRCGTIEVNRRIRIKQKELEEQKKQAMTASFYDYKITDKNNNEIPMSNFKGKVVLIVNTDKVYNTFEPQYEPLEAMYEKYHDQGLEIIDVPCDEFPTISTYYNYDKLKSELEKLNHHLFIEAKESKVNGLDELPIYTFLKQKKTFKGFGEGKIADSIRNRIVRLNRKSEESDIKTDFTKFLIDKNGNVVERFEVTEDMQKIEEKIKSLLSEKY